ncbi:hypothetical protein ACHAXS_009616, partial [Conticribra weissflogii]
PIIDENVTLHPSFDWDHITERDTKPSPPNDLILHAISVGEYRTASTLQFNAVCVSLFLRLLDVSPDLANETTCSFVEESFENMEQRWKSNPWVIKMHVMPKHTAVLNDTWLFSTVKDRSEGGVVKTWLMETYGRPERIGYIQDLETLSEIGLEGVIRNYADVFSLKPFMIDAMIEYFRFWEKLRICCGKQMSKYWRNELLPFNSTLKDVRMSRHALCPRLNIDEVEKRFMETKLYRLIHRNEKLRRMNRPSLVDGDLTGKYCSDYNIQVKTHGIGFNEGR